MKRNRKVVKKATGQKIAYGAFPPLASVLVLLVVGLVLGGVGSVQGGSQCPAAIEEDPQVSDKVEYGGCTIVVRSDLTVVGDEGELLVSDVTLRFEGQDRTLRVEAGGAFVANDTSRLEAASDGTFSVVFEEGSSGAFNGSTVWRHTDLVVESSDVTLANGTVLEDARQSGLSIRKASPTVRNLTVDGASVNGVLVDGASPDFDNVEVVNGSETGIWVGPGSAVTSNRSTWSGVDAGVVLEGDAEMVHRNGSFGSAPTEAVLRSTPGEDPRLYLQGTTFDESNITFDGEGRIDVAWYAQLQVQADPQGSIDMDLVEFRVRNATGAVHHDATLDDDGRSPVLFLPSRAFNQDGPLLGHNPWSFKLRRDAYINQTSVSVAKNRVAEPIEVVLPKEEDIEDPAWPESESTILGPGPADKGGSEDPNVTLKWPEATDNRSVDHYEVFRSGPDEGPSKKVEAFGTTYTFEGLIEGEHTFKVRPVDIAGNRGTFSNVLDVVVDLDTPPLTVAINGTVGPVSGHYRAPFGINATTSDDAQLTIAIDEGAAEALVEEARFEDPGSYNVTVAATDPAGNVNETQLHLILDVDAPTILAEISPGIPEGAEGWYTDPPVLSIESSDRGQSGLHEVAYRLHKEGPWRAYNDSTPITDQGDHMLAVRVVDRAGNVGSAQLRLPVDTSGPTINVTADGPRGSNDWYVGPVAFDTETADSASGVTRIEYREDGHAWIPFQSPLRLDHVGSKVVDIRAVDRAGLSSNVTTQTVTIDPDAPIPPTPRWTVRSDGLVHVDWRDGPPADPTSGISRVVVQRANATGAILSELSVPVSRANHTVGPFPAGTHRFRLLVEDVAGNNVTTEWATVPVTQSPAGIRLGGGDTVARGVETVTYTPPHGVDPAEVRFYVDDHLVSSTDQRPYTFTWNTANYADGPHNVRIVAVDDDGQRDVQETPYEVRNAYAAKLSDGDLAFAFGMIIVASAAGLSVLGYRHWRRWTAR